MFFNSPTIKQQIASNEVHLWTITPQKISSPTQLTYLKSLLNKDELNKYQKYRHPKNQHTALVTRAFIRTVLALYLNKHPHDLEFTINPHGKPELSNRDIPLRFNLSHNDQLIICSVCLDHDIGCDIENINRKISIDSIAKRYFSAAESKALLALPAAIKQSRFFEYWTLKEAFVKAMGIGISFGLETFSFEITPSEKMKFNDSIKLTIADKHPALNAKTWYHCLIYPDQTHCIAISVNRQKINHPIKIKKIDADNFI